ncbi:sensor histidine kinase [Candidatus Neoehrlichia procyonis]|uniref:histidine kinase n=1 Tax=Candidatus Neoehrlichia procyonis str. RAC413 TaxID=1359163 RepID=A0A0F3NRW6_9RICK|nr:HAMP domain-containing sensor histidine kinase [Candidatus Neoehrlichia lotoris]KJV69619.1 his Kinase A domain protein [Candidatus Neoehrlichia lotoris str. RAC413]
MKYVKVALLLVLVSTLIIVTGYMHIYLKYNSLYSISQEINTNVRDIIVNSILNKYTYLLSKIPNHVGVSPYYVNVLIKLRAEFIKTLKGIDDISVVLYNLDGNIILTTDNNVSNAHKSCNQKLLSSEEIDILLTKGSLYSTVDGSTVTTVFPVFTSSSNYLKPIMFLKVTKNFTSLSSFITKTYVILTFFIALIVLVCIIFVFFIYNRNTKILSKQYDTNLKLKEAKEIAEKENVSKSQFFANVSHELRTPLNSIIGFSEIICNESMGAIGNKQYKEYINDIYQSGVHLLSIINDLLDFSKAEANKLTVQPIKFDLLKVIESCCNMVLQRASETKIKIEKEFPNNDVIMFADPKRIKQVIINILSNSIKFTQENGCVKLYVEANTEEIIIEISDNGIGIAQQDIYKVMSIFGQADSEHSRKYEGTGLGLPLSKKLVELMNGVFKIKSEPNLGTVVTLIFPNVNQDKKPF